MSDPPEFVAVRNHVRDELVRFVRALRRAGVAVAPSSATTAARALVEIGFDDAERAKAALRACLVSDPEAITVFDRQFPEFWRRLTAGLGPDGPAPRRDGPEGAPAPLGGDPSAAESGPDPTAVENDTTAVTDDGWQPTNGLGALVTTDVGTDGEGREEVELEWYSPSGRREQVSGVTDETAHGVEELTRAIATLRGRRWTAGGNDGIDIRWALRRSFGTGGTVVSLPRRERPATAVRAVWLVDVSRSVLETVDRSFLLGMLRRARAEWRDCRVFFFDEDCREVTDAFDRTTADDAVTALEQATVEWGGGTRIGGSLASLREQAPDAVDGRTVVFVVSDGLEMGNIDVLERELSNLSRHAASVLWLNPLASSANYEPTARGMAAAMPFVDGLFAFGTAEDLREVGRQLRRYGPTGRIGYAYDPRRGAS